MYGGLLTPPLLLDALAKAARGKQAALFCEVLEEARTALFEPLLRPRHKRQESLYDQNIPLVLRPIRYS